MSNPEVGDTPLYRGDVLEPGESSRKKWYVELDKPAQGEVLNMAYLDDNPKDALGRFKVPLELLPPAGLIYQAMAQGYGAAKYGPFNWRTKRVKGMIYAGAARRHILAYIDGHDLDDGYQGSGLPHLGMAMACIAILIDATETGNLQDDRPPAGEMTALMDKWNLWLRNGGWGVERQTDVLKP